MVTPDGPSAQGACPISGIGRSGAVVHGLVMSTMYAEFVSLALVWGLLASAVTTFTLLVLILTRD